LGLNTTWRFFAPNPPKTRKAQIEVQLESGEIKSFEWPPSVESFRFHSNYYRRYYSMIIMTSSFKAFNLVFAPIFCQRYSNAYSVRMDVLEKPLPYMNSNRQISSSIDFVKINENSVVCE
jgi:hypothetical protein